MHRTYWQPTIDELPAGKLWSICITVLDDVVAHAMGLLDKCELVFEATDVLDVLGEAKVAFTGTEVYGG